MGVETNDEKVNKACNLIGWSLIGKVPPCNFFDIFCDRLRLSRTCLHWRLYSGAPRQPKFQRQSTKNTQKV